MTKNRPSLVQDSSGIRYHMLVTSKELSEMVGIELTKIRRYVKEVLDPDPEATRQSGKSRRYGLKEAFKVYLAHFLVSKYGFVTEEAEAIIKDIDPWLDEQRMYPEYEFPVSGDDGGVANDACVLDDGTTLPETRIPIYYPMTIQIMRANTVSGFYYVSISEIERKQLNKDGRREVRTRCFHDPILPKTKNFICDDSVTYIIPIDTLRKKFRAAVGIPSQVF